MLDFQYYFEFQNQYAKIKRKKKFIREQKNAKRKLDNYTIYVNQKAKERREFLGIIDNFNDTKNKNKEISVLNNNVNNLIDIMDSSMNINDSTPNRKINDNEKYKVKASIKENQKLKRKINAYMRKSLYQDIKDQGIYSDTEEENEDDSIQNEDISDEINKDENNAKDTHEERKEN